MPIKIYDTLSRRKKLLRLPGGKSLNLFVCGPTVYDFSHIGHARTYIVFDAIAKYLKVQGAKVFYLQNITDIDDKIINRAKELGVNPQNLARRFEKEYYQDMRALGIDSVTKYARATDYASQIIKQIKRLIKKGFAYVSSNSVYYDISKFPEYGKLSRQSLKSLKKNVRIEPDPFKKGDFDFVLWKAAKPGEPSWSSPWGEGRPGWHIEDTAITEHHFGPQYDIHGGGLDLIFPHHESEISQMEAVSGKKPMVRYWMHTGFLMVGGEKMAKSLGNFITIRDFLKKYPPELLRFIVLSSHYRSPVDYTVDSAKQAKASLERIREFLEKLDRKTEEGGRQKMKERKSKKNRIKTILAATKKKFHQEIEDDFNTPRALAAVFNLIKKNNPLLDQDKLSLRDKKEILSFLEEIDAILGILPSEKKEKIPPEIKDLAAEREKLRQEKNWSEADEIRKKIEAAGYKIEDKPEGPRVKTNIN